MPIKREDLIPGAEFVHRSTGVHRIVKVVSDQFVIYTAEPDGGELFAYIVDALQYWEPAPKTEVRYVHWFKDEDGHFHTYTTGDERPPSPATRQWLRSDKVTYTEGVTHDPS